MSRTFALSFRLAWKYFLSNHRHPFVGIISNISVLGVAVGVCALITVLAVMSGFQQDLTDRIVGTYADAIVESDRAIPLDTPLLDSILQFDPAIQGISPHVMSQAIVQTPTASRGVLVRAARFLDEKSLKIEDHIEFGAYPEESQNEVMLGSELIRQLNTRVGENILVYTSQSRKPYTLRISGLFHSGMYDYDANLMYLPLSLGQEIFGIEGYSGISVKFNSPENAIRLQRALQLRLGWEVMVRTWKDRNAALFGALKLEKVVMFIILALIVLVASFNIIGTLTLLVMDRTRDLGILKAIGATPRFVMAVFSWVGFLIGSFGTGLGLFLGLGLSVLLRDHSPIVLPKEIYYFDKLPVDLRGDDIFFVCLAAMMIALLSAIYPAYSASKTPIAQALRYE